MSSRGSACLYDTLMLALDLRLAAASAAAEANGQKHKSDSYPAGEYLDPEFHCSGAEALVRPMLLARPPLTAEGLAGQVLQPAIAPSAELYLLLMTIHDAAGLTFRAMRLAMEVLTGELPLEGESQMESVAAGAMTLSNSVGAYRAAAMVFDQVLQRSGRVCSISIMKEARWAGPFNICSNDIAAWGPLHCNAHKTGL